MRYWNRAKRISIGGGSLVQDDTGNDLYTINGHVGLQRKLELKDAQGHDLATIRQKGLSAATFKIQVGQSVSAEISRKGGVFHQEYFKIVVMGQEEMHARGDFATREYAISRGTQIVAQISQSGRAPGNTLGDPYSIDTDEKQAPLLLLLCCTAVIDEIYDLR